MNRKDKLKILKELKLNEFFELGNYNRIYPDSLEETSGIFVLKLEHYYNLNDFNYAKSIFEIKAIEGDFELDIGRNFEFWETFTSKRESYEHLLGFLEKFDTIKDLYNHILSKSGFSATRRNLLLFNELKEMLPDSETFETFNESLGCY